MGRMAQEPFTRASGESPGLIRVPGLYAAGVIMPETRSATPYFVINGNLPGPTVMVVGGIHGDEVSGYMAGQQLKECRVDRGKLVVVPEANRPAILVNRRHAEDGDLNRQFPRASLLAAALFSLALECKPDVLIDLHEGIDYYGVNARSVGQTVIYYPAGNARSIALTVADELNRYISNPVRRFGVLRFPVVGSFARSIGETLHIPAFIIETVNRDALDTRIFLHIAAVTRILRCQGINPVR